MQNTISAISGFINPFAAGVEDLVCISSGIKLADDATETLLHLEAQGKKSFEDFVTERLVKKTVLFHYPIKRQNVITFTSLAKQTKITSSKSKTIKITAQRDVFGQLQIILEHIPCIYPRKNRVWSHIT